MLIARVNSLVAAPLVGVVLLLIAAGCLWAAEPDSDPPVGKQVRGTDLGGAQPTVYVVRDKAAWDSVKRDMSDRRMLPRGAKPGEGLESLDDTDFQQDMIVAVFWGKMNFSRNDEKCWIEAVDIGERQVTVDCRAKLWGGAVKASYLAWPYDAKVVRRSDLPVTFVQTTEYEANPKASEKNKVLATLKSDEWKREVERTE